MSTHLLFEGRHASEAGALDMQSHAMIMLQCCHIVIVPRLISRSG